MRGRLKLWLAVAPVWLDGIRPTLRQKVQRHVLMGGVKVSSGDVISENATYNYATNIEN